MYVNSVCSQIQRISNQWHKQADFQFGRAASKAFIAKNLQMISVSTWRLRKTPITYFIDVIVFFFPWFLSFAGLSIFVILIFKRN